MQMPVDQTIFDAPGTEIEALGYVARFSLRVKEKDRETISGVLGLNLPPKIGARAKAGQREALCLGPDEWVLTAPEAEADAITNSLGDAYEATPHSCTDITDREISFRISGPEAASLMAAGCPRDLRRIAPGTGTRTIFSGASVVLWRDAEDTFRLDVWRTFAPHVLSLLRTAQGEIALGL